MLLHRALDRRALARIARRERLDVLLLPALFERAFFGADGLSCPTVQVCHDLTPYHTGEAFGQGRLYGWLYMQDVRGLARADRVLAISEATRRDVLQLAGADPARVRVIYQGIDPMFRPVPEEQVRAIKARFCPDGDFFLASGGLSEQQEPGNGGGRAGGVAGDDPASSPPARPGGTAGCFSPAPGGARRSGAGTGADCGGGHRLPAARLRRGTGGAVRGLGRAGVPVAAGRLRAAARRVHGLRLTGHRVRHDRLCRKWRGTRACWPTRRTRRASRRLMARLLDEPAWRQEVIARGLRAGGPVRLAPVGGADMALLREVAGEAPRP